MKKFVVLVSAFALAGCIDRATVQEQKADIETIQSTLPSGCTLHYAGEVRVEGYRENRPSRVFVTVCGNTVTTSETHTVQQGKATVDENTVAVFTK